MNNDLKSGCTTVVVVVICLGCAVVLCNLIYLKVIIANQPKISEVTTPLPRSVVEDLCALLSLPDNDIRCQPTAKVYALDFFADVRELFTIGEDTYQDVHALLGAYEYYCEERTPTADGDAYFRCWYDFRGDRSYPIIFRFSGIEDVLDYINAPVRDFM